MIMSYYNHRHVDRYVYIRQLQRWCRARSRLILAPTLMRNSTRSCGHVICWHLKGCETMTELCKGSGYLVGITLLEEFIGKVLSMKSRAYFQDVSFFQSVSWFFPTFKQMFSHQRQMSAARSLWMPQRSQRKTRCSETSLGIWVLYLVLTCLGTMCLPKPAHHLVRQAKYTKIILALWD